MDNENDAEIDRNWLEMTLKLIKNNIEIDQKWHWDWLKMTLELTQNDTETD